MRIGSGYKGSVALQTSVANAEILPAKPVGWTVPYNFYKFSFECDSDCTMIVNGEEIFLRANRVWSIDSEDKPITSFKIKEPNLTFTWYGNY
jgi:hypothetical protein